MDERVLAVWRVLWPKAIPEHEYEAALMQAELVGATGRKPEPRPAPASPAAGAEDEDLIETKDAARILGLSKQAFGDRVRRGMLKRHPSSTPRRALYRRADVEAQPMKVNTGRGASRTAPASHGVSKDLIAAPEAAKLIGISYNGLLHRAQVGLIRSYPGKSDRHRLFSRADLAGQKPNQKRFSSRHAKPGAKGQLPFPRLVQESQGEAPPAEPEQAKPPAVEAAAGLTEYTVRQAADALNVGMFVIYDAMARGALKATKHGKGINAPKSIASVDLEAFRAKRAAQ